MLTAERALRPHPQPPRQWRWLLPVTVAASTAAWVTGASAGRLQGAPRVSLLVAGAIFTALAAGVPLWQQARAARGRAQAVASAEGARAAMRVALEDALDPFAALLMQLTTAKAVDKARLHGAATQLALASIARLNGLSTGAGSDPTRVRVCFFAFVPGPPPQLVPMTYAGRSGAPTRGFDDTTRAGQYLLHVLDRGWVLVPDTDDLRTGCWWDDDRAYRTFAAGPVPTAEGPPAGLLTLDALTPGELDGLDLPLVRLQAHLLGLALRL